MSILSFQMPDKVTLENGDEQEATFVFKPLERGFGTTIGNALRRILLSSLEGYAITFVKFPSIMHEFSTVDGIVEDVTHIILNLKMLRFKKIGNSSEEQISLKITKQKTFTGKDIQQVSSCFEVLNPDHVICHLDLSASLELTLTINKGRGYVPAEENVQKNDQEYGLIAIDSVFTPIKNVQYFVENTRVEQRTDYERLSISVKTDGSITPRLALQEASNILIKHFVLFSDKGMGTGIETEPEVEVVDEDTLRMRKLLKTSLEDLELSVRAYNCLKTANIRTLGDIVQLEVSQMMKFRNFGKKSLTELKQLIAEKNISFGMDISPYKLDE